MSKRLISTLALALVLVVSCTSNPMGLEMGFGQLCPQWADYDTPSCDVGLWHSSGTSSYLEVHLTDWDKMRFTTVGEDVLIDNAENVVFMDDYGEDVRFSSTRFIPGSYVAVRVDLTKPAGFRITNAGDSYVYVIAELVRTAGQ